MTASELTEPGVGAIFAWERISVCARGGGRGDGISVAGASAGRWTVAIVAGELAETYIITWASTGYADASWGYASSRGLGGRGCGCGCRWRRWRRGSPRRGFC